MISRGEIEMREDDGKMQAAFSLAALVGELDQLLARIRERVDGQPALLHVLQLQV